MKRDEFLKKGLIGLGAVMVTPVILSSCSKDATEIDPDACIVSPEGDVGPFPIKTPADLINSNIIGDRIGTPLVINYTIHDVGNGCAPMAGVYVDIWHCDAKGNYSEYAGQLDGDFTQKHFLRGRQLTNANGQVSFISVYPGWYPDRAPHIHVEILDSSNKSLLVTQTAFPEETSKVVYATTNYNGVFDTLNANDGIFGANLNRSMANTVTGNLSDGYVLNETIKV